MKEQTLREKQEAFINDTVAYYSADPKSRRSISAWGCSYSSKNGTSAGCAIGRHLDKDLCITLDRYTSPGVSNPKVFNKLPPELRELTMGLLVDMQSLHDIGSYWVGGEVGEDRRKKYLDTVRARLDQTALKQ